MPLATIDTSEIEITAVRLNARIHERFPGSGLERRSRELIELCQQMGSRAEELSRPILWVRWLYAILVLVVVVVMSTISVNLSLSGLETIDDWVPFVEAAVNDLIFLGAGLFFLSTLETRIKRRRVLAELHEIRSFAHVIDMMQLTKDPQRLAGQDHRPTSASPTADLTAFELGRYLDYCTEMLAISSKGAAVVAQRFDDPAVLATVNEIENLTTGLSRKIWQKLMILMTTNPEAAPTALTPTSNRD
ncbi:MAG: hypothetical protein AAGA93_08760 [Actinomycetota bacterium]